MVYSDKILEIIYGVFHVLYFDLSLSQLHVNETALKIIGLFLQITAVDTPTICQTCRKAGRSLRNMGSTQVALNLGLFFWCWQLVLLLLDRTSLKSMTLGGYIRDVELNIRRWAAREEPRVCIPTAEPVKPFITPFFVCCF